MRGLDLSPITVQASASQQPPAEEKMLPASQYQVQLAQREATEARQRSAEPVIEGAAVLRQRAHRDSLESAPSLIDVDEVARALGVSRRHVFTLSDSGQMPAPIRLGR